MVVDNHGSPPGARIFSSPLSFTDLFVREPLRRGEGVAQVEVDEIVVLDTKAQPLR
jgi:hypothetical protein